MAGASASAFPLGGCNVIKFKLTKQVVGQVNVYGGDKVSAGETFGISDEWLIAKARANPDFSEVKKTARRKKAD